MFLCITTKYNNNQTVPRGKAELPFTPPMEKNVTNSSEEKVIKKYEVKIHRKGEVL